MWSLQKANLVYDTREVQLAPKAATSLGSTTTDIVKPLTLGTSQTWVRHRSRDTYVSFNGLSVALLTSLEMEKYPWRRKSRENATAL